MWSRYQYGRTLKHRRVSYAAAVLVVFISFVPVWANHFKKTTQVSTPKNLKSIAHTPRPAEAQSLTASSMFVGEVFWGRGIDYFAKRSPLKYQFPFSVHGYA